MAQIRVFWRDARVFQLKQNHQVSTVYPELQRMHLTDSVHHLAITSAFSARWQHCLCSSPTYKDTATFALTESSSLNQEYHALYTTTLENADHTLYMYTHSHKQRYLNLTQSNNEHPISLLASNPKNKIVHFVWQGELWQLGHVYSQWPSNEVSPCIINILLLLSNFLLAPNRISGDGGLK